MATVQANYAELGNIGNRFTTAAVDVRAVRDQVRSSVDAFRSGWIGESSRAFCAAAERDLLPALERLASALEQTTTTTNDIAAILARGEDEASALFRG